MTYKEMKAKLEAIGAKRRLLGSIERQLAEARAEADCLRGGGQGVRVSGGVKEPAAQRYVERVDRLECRRKELLADLTVEEADVEMLLRELDPVEEAIIRARYLAGKRWRTVQREVGYERAQPFRIARRAVSKLAKLCQNPQR